MATKGDKTVTATITWFGHATVRLTLVDERVIIIDPWLDGNPACPDNLKKLSRCDMVFVTPGHFDHVADVKTIVETFDPLVVGNFELCNVLEKQIGGKKAKLGNEKFVANANPEIVEAERTRLAELLEQRAALTTHLSELNG